VKALPRYQAPKAGQNVACDDGMNGDDDLFKAQQGTEVRQLLQHFFDVHPRNEDLDISANADRLGNNAPAGRVSILAGATASVKIRSRPGFVLYMDRVRVARSDGNVDLSLTTVQVLKQGIQVGFLPDTRFRRRAFLDRDDLLVINITNGTAGTLSYDYSVEGFARRAGIPEMQPNRSGGRS
jgi:hypothetical protein